MASLMRDINEHLRKPEEFNLDARRKSNAFDLIRLYFMRVHRGGQANGNVAVEISCSVAERIIEY